MSRISTGRVDLHYSDVIMSAMALPITGITIVYRTVCSCADQRKHQSSASLDFVGWIHRWLVNSPQKGPVTRERLPFDDVIMSGLPAVMHFRGSWGCLISVAPRQLLHKCWPSRYCIDEIIYYSQPYWGRDKMAAFSQTTLSNAFF